MVIILYSQSYFDMFRGGVFYGHGVHQFTCGIRPTFLLHSVNLILLLIFTPVSPHLAHITSSQPLSSLSSSVT